MDVRKVDLSIELQILAFHAQRRSDVRVAAGGKRHYHCGVGLAALAGSPGESVTSAMSVLVVGLSHRSAPVAVLERAAVSW